MDEPMTKWWLLEQTVGLHTRVNALLLPQSYCNWNPGSCQEFSAWIIQLASFWTQIILFISLSDVYPKSLNTSLVPRNRSCRRDRSWIRLCTFSWLVVFRHPSEKNDFVSWDYDIPNIQKNMFQINNQLGSLYSNQLLSGRMKSKLSKTKWWTENPNYEPN